jgi:hypothetical protein
MSERARIATSLLSLAAIAAILVLLGIGAPGKAAESPCGAATDRTYFSTAFTVALRISAAERTGVSVRHAVHTIENDTILANAVASGDRATLRSEILVLLYNHEHIVRLRVLRAGHLLADVGGPLVHSPVSGSLRVHGRVVGTFVMSAQDDLGYRLLAERLLGAHTVMRYQDATVMRDITVPSAPLPERGTVLVGRVAYLVGSFTVGRFPDGELRISLLLRRPGAALARQSCAQVRADELANIARRAYHEAKAGTSVVGPALKAIARTPALPAALAAGDDAAAAGIVKALVAAGGFTRLRVLVGTHVVADVGRSFALLAPVRVPLVDSGGSVVGQAVFAVQSAHGYADLARYLTQSPVLVRAGTRQIGGTFAGPATLPTSGPVTYLGVRYEVASFAGEQYPSGRLTIYVLGPG